MSEANQMQTLQTLDKSVDQHQNSDCINLKQFLEDTELLKSTNQNNTNCSNNTPDLVLTVGSNKGNKVNRFKFTLLNFIYNCFRSSTDMSVQGRLKYKLNLCHNIHRLLLLLHA